MKQWEKDMKTATFALDLLTNQALLARKTSSKKKKGYFKVYYVFADRFYYEEGDALFKKRIDKIVKQKSKSGAKE